ncbi:MAG: hypothetical protein ACYCVW_02475 [Rhodocyclaceae bacterium]
MKFIGILLSGIAMTMAMSAYSQDTILGTYSGSASLRNNKTAGIRLLIDSVENGVVKGTASRFQRGSCNGDYPVEGALKDGNLIMKASEKGGPAADCNFKLNVKVIGEKLVGTWIGDQPIELSK